jgi:hypothetical protein
MYSQAGQDKFVLSLINDNSNHFFFDVGCWLPTTINNTFLLEQQGWDGISIDITNLSNEWQIRKSKFICANALTVEYESLMNNNNAPKIIDYLNVDIEGNGERYNVLKNIIKTSREFKIITIEHDVYRGYNETEKKPQVELLSKMGYTLVCSNVMLSGNAFEDWWVNPKFVDLKKYSHLICENKDAIEIINNL